MRIELEFLNRAGNEPIHASVPDCQGVIPQKNETIYLDFAEKYRIVDRVFYYGRDQLKVSLHCERDALADVIANLSPEDRKLL